MNPDYESAVTRGEVLTRMSSSMNGDYVLNDDGQELIFIHSTLASTRKSGYSLLIFRHYRLDDNQVSPNTPHVPDSRLT